jgi:integral membrane protein (TIGR00529 family)
MDPIISISIILVVMILIVALKINLSYALFFGILLCSAFFNKFSFLMGDFIETAKTPSNTFLLIAVILIFFLARLMEENGMLKNLLASLEKYIKKPWVVITAIPMLIGIIPTPSGAILSAPFVSEMGNRSKVPKLRLHLINYWFRHSVSEYINPIFPGVLLAASVAGLPFGIFALLNAPLMALATILGLLFFVRGLGQKTSKKTKPGKQDMIIVIKGLIPLLIALLLPVLFGVNLAIAMAVAVVFTVIANRIRFVNLGKIFVKSLKLDLVVMIFLILLFKTVLTNSKAMEQVAASFIRMHFPFIVLILLIPFLVGFVTGITMAFVGIAFPLLLPFMKVNGDLNLGLLMLGYEAGYLGLMLSPMHLCLSATAQYFKVEYKDILKKLLIPQLIVLGFALLLYLIGWPFF